MHGIEIDKTNFLRKPFGAPLGGPLLNALGSLEPPLGAVLGLGSTSKCQGSRSCRNWVRALPNPVSDSHENSQADGR